MLEAISRCSEDNVDAVFALLDTRESWFAKPPKGARFCDGASTAHIGAHVGILQRAGTTKLDREGRDYWIKPLRELGIVEAVYLDPKSRTFIYGHPKAKSPNSAYRLTKEFVEILKAPAKSWEKGLRAWASEEAIRKRARFQAEMEEKAKLAIDRSHSDLIEACIDGYAPAFLPGFEVLYVDDGDGDRIAPEARQKLAGAGIELELSDAMPDVLLWNQETDELWVIEAVTSDGEVDSHKVDQMQKLAERSGKKRVGFTTAYPTWKVAAARQHAYKNIAAGTYVWIREDPTKHFLAETFDADPVTGP